MSFIYNETIVSIEITGVSFDMPPSQPSNLPSKKRRASSASASAEETGPKEASASSAPPTETIPEPAPDNSQNPAQKCKISPSRLPSKKRKSSHDSAQPSVNSGQGTNDEYRKKHHNSVASESIQHTKLSKTDGRSQAISNDADDITVKAAPASAVASNEKSPERRSRKNSTESLGANLRNHLNDTLSSPSSSPARPRLRSDSQFSLDNPFSQRKWSQDTGASLDIFAPRKESSDTTQSVKLDMLLDLPPPEPININPKIGEEFDIPTTRPRSNSTASLVNEGILSVGGGALEHLDALADDSKPAAKRKDSSEADDNSSAAETFASSGHRVLMEAIKLAAGDESGSKGSKTSSQEAQPRERLESWGGRDRFESLGSVLDSAAFTSHGRDRLESWGGMSDLSITFGAGGSSSERGISSAAAAAAAAAAAVAEQFELAGGGEDFAGLGLDDFQRHRSSSVPSRISLGRERFNSIASFSEASFLPDGAEATIDLNSIVAAAMAHVGDLAELAGIVETVAAGSEGDPEADASETSSIASPIIGATVEGGNRGARRQRPRSWSTSSRMSVDYEALASAVDAAQAAAGNFDLNALGSDQNTSGSGRTGDCSSSDGRRKEKSARSSWRRQLPLKRDRTASEGTEEDSDTKMKGKEMDRIRKRARMAATGTTPTKDKPSSRKKKQSIPLKKRVKRQNSSPPQPEGPLSSSSPAQTPRVFNRSIAAVDEMPDLPQSSTDKSGSKGQASQKWDSMFDSLLAYIEERRQEDTLNSTEEEKKDWIWDGNVPTTYKTTDGKALGRWVNNQRSAKAKGTLKADREERLIQAGLKWSVLASNSWNETLEELQKYINDQTKDGKKWDGNVPTHYQIKAKPNGKFSGEDKNLGRWVNRQRSLYQAGKLRKDRQIALERLGLKWSMLSSTSWESMFQTLEEYIEERKQKEGTWDGNVPANFRTNDNPPRALGRWVNRQRSAYSKGKLKTECVDQLNAVGLKWSVHEKNGRSSQDLDVGEDEFDDNGEDEYMGGGETSTKSSGVKDARFADAVESSLDRTIKAETILKGSTHSKTVEEEAAALSQGPSVQSHKAPVSV